MFIEGQRSFRETFDEINLQKKLIFFFDVLHFMKVQDSTASNTFRETYQNVNKWEQKRVLWKFESAKLLEVKKQSEN